MTKIDIFSGFLGAGKTTFIKALIEKVFRGEKIVLIENEFGEIGIDSRFMQNCGIEVTEMNSGCICDYLNWDIVCCRTFTAAKPSDLAADEKAMAELKGIADALKQN